MNGYIPSMRWPSSVTFSIALESECSPSVLVTLLTWKIRCLFRNVCRSVTCRDRSGPCAHKSEADMDKIARTHTHTHTCVCSKVCTHTRLCLFWRIGKVPPTARLKPSSLLWLDYSAIPLTIRGPRLPVTGALQPVWTNTAANFCAWKTWSVATVSSSQAEAAMLSEWEMGWWRTKPSKYITVHNCWRQKMLAAANDAVVYSTRERSRCMRVKKHEALGWKWEGLRAQRVTLN